MQPQMTALQRREQFLERPLPSNEDAERCVLGAILIDERLISTVAEIVKPEDLYSPSYRRIYAAMLTLFEAKKAIDPIAIVEELKKEGPLDTIGGYAAITNLSFGLPMWSLESADVIQGYCRTIQDKRKVRDLIKTCNLITTEALAGEQDPSEILNAAQTAINAVCTIDDKKGFEGLGTVAVSELHRIIELRERGNVVTGLQTGLAKLDLLTGGFQKSDLVIIAGRPGMGKSALAGQIALNACEQNPGAVVAIFSLEMSKEQYAKRLLSTRSSIDFTRMSRGALNDDELARLARCSGGFGDLGFVIDDSSSISAVEMRSKLLRLKHERGRLDAIFVDYLQRMVTGKRVESRQQEVSRIAQDLKSLAKDFDVPVIALSSLNRQCEARNPPKPRMSDLRDSGDIESEADLVAFIYRPHHYDQSMNPRLCEFIIDKHRNGPTETVQLGFMGEFTRFGNYEF